MPVAANNPHKIGTSEWYEYNTPGIFNASKNYTPAETQRQYQTRVAAGEVDPKTGQLNYPTRYGGSTGIYPSFTTYGGVNFDSAPGSTYGGNTNPYPTFNPNGGGGGGGGGRGGGGGGGGGAPVPDYSAIMALLNRKPQQYEWKDMGFTPYEGTGFYDFNGEQFARARSGLTDAISADRSAGANSYAQGMAELQQYQNPFNNPTTVTNPQQSAAMQRMMQANNVATDINQADTNRGVQADQAFGNLLAVLGGVNDQAQASRVRALQGDQRGFNERLDAELRGGNLSVDMAEAAARQQYEKDKWAYGEQIAQMNYAEARKVIEYNNTGQNQTAQANTQTANTWNQNNIQTIIDMIASGGGGIDPNAYTGA